MIILLLPLPHPAGGHAGAQGAVPNPLQEAQPSEKEVMSVSQCVSSHATTSTLRQGRTLPSHFNIFQIAPSCLICLNPSHLPLTKQPPKYLWKCKAGTSAALIAVRVCVLAGEMGEKVAIGVSHKIYSLQLYRDLLDWGVH